MRLETGQVVNGRRSLGGSVGSSEGRSSLRGLDPSASRRDLDHGAGAEFLFANDSDVVAADPDVVADSNGHLVADLAAVQASAVRGTQVSDDDVAVGTVAEPGVLS